jgi:probable DNA metabolism protein
MRILSCYDFETWKRKTKQMLNQNVHPREILWQNANDEKTQKLLESSNEIQDESSYKVYKVSRSLIQLAEIVSLHKDSQKWELLYSVLWRTLHGEPFLLDGETDFEVRWLLLMRKQVRREIRKIKTFVRFKKASTAKGEHLIAWYECEHNVLRHAVPFYKRRFNSIPWTLFTPYGSARWDKESMTYTEVNSDHEMTSEQLEQIWQANTGSPSVQKITPFKEDFLEKYLRQSFETEGTLLQLKESYMNTWKTSKNSSHSSANCTAQDSSPVNLKTDIQKCTKCNLNCSENSPVTGEGHQRPEILFVAEKPEKNKHAARRQLIQKILLQTKQSKSNFHLTYALKNETPDTDHLDTQMQSCQPWLAAEIKTLRPKKIVCLGTRAARAVLAREITREELKKDSSIFTSSFELVIVEDCFSYMSHPQFKEKFQEFTHRVENLFLSECAA